MPPDVPGPAGLEEERLFRCCFALALYIGVFRAGLLPGSRLLTLDRTATLGDLLALASEAEVADVLALADAARRELAPAVAARGEPLHLGPTFAGSRDVGGADADVIAGGLLLEWKATVGPRRQRDGRRYCPTTGSPPPAGPGWRSATAAVAGPHDWRTQCFGRLVGGWS